MLRVPGMSAGVTQRVRGGNFTALEPTLQLVECATEFCWSSWIMCAALCRVGERRYRIGARLAGMGHKSEVLEEGEQAIIGRLVAPGGGGSGAVRATRATTASPDGPR